MVVEITDMQRSDVAHKLKALDMSDIDVDVCERTYEKDQKSGER